MDNNELQLTLADVVKTLNQTIGALGRIDRNFQSLIHTLSEHVDESFKKTFREQYLSQGADEIKSQYAQVTQKLSEIEKKLRNTPKA